jgi:predicted  nucleic acid-binding Zn-ribbon protein
MSSGRDLWRLQQVDTRIAAVEADVARAEAQLRRDPELERAREAAAVAERERQAAEGAAASGEAEMNALQNRVTALDRHLYGGSVHNPQDLLEMQRELDVLRGRLSDAEDRAIAQLGDLEAAGVAERDALSGLRSAEQRREADVGPLEHRLGDAHAELETARGARDALTADIDPASLALYRRVAQRRTPAVVGLDGDTCGGCHLPVSTEERRLVRAGAEIVQCSNCDRILVP